MTNPLTAADLDAIRARLERYMQFVDASLSRDAVEDRIKAFDKATGMVCLFARDTDLLLAHADQQQARIDTLEEAHRKIASFKRIEAIDAFDKGFNDGTFRARQIARDALKGSE